MEFSPPLADGSECATASSSTPTPWQCRTTLIQENRDTIPFPSTSLEHLPLPDLRQLPLGAPALELPLSELDLLRRERARARQRDHDNEAPAPPMDMGREWIREERQLQARVEQHQRPAQRPVWEVVTREQEYAQRRESIDERLQKEEAKTEQLRKWIDAERKRADAERAEKEAAEEERERVEEMQRALEEEWMEERERRAREQAERRPPPPPPPNAVARAKWALEDTLDAARRKLLRKPPMSQREQRARLERRHPEWRVRYQTPRRGGPRGDGGAPLEWRDTDTPSRPPTPDDRRRPVLFEPPPRPPSPDGSSPRMRPMFDD